MRIICSCGLLGVLLLSGCNQSFNDDVNSQQLAPVSVPPATPLDPRQQLREKLRAHLGEDRIPRVALWKSDLTIQLVIAVGHSARETLSTTDEEIALILHEAIAFDFWEKISIEGYGTTRNDFGRSQTELVLDATYERWTVEKIHWPNFDPAKVLKIKNTGRGWITKGSD